jgi:hypothetical protein
MTMQRGSLALWATSSGGLTGAANKSDTVLGGSIVGPGCTTFSVSR